MRFDTGQLLTDDKGRPLGYDMSEPRPGSIVMTNGGHGTAWQRRFIDGRWSSTAYQETRDWEWICRQRNLVLVYDAPERD